ncbi:Cytochrome B561 (fragment) [Hyella patelloides LEGE 07179]|uniref:Cytochrome B561 n=1 Tax=Hyella patelloides LEGE 07179 TaxID=945734 RepID=A0A563VL74_9CYAN
MEVSGFADSVHFWISYTFLAFIILHTLDQKRYLRAQLRRFSKATLSKISDR